MYKDFQRLEGLAVFNYIKNDSMNTFPKKIYAPLPKFFEACYWNHRLILNHTNYASISKLPLNNLADLASITSYNFLKFIKHHKMSCMPKTL
jgi:hypothetical protein